MKSGIEKNYYMKKILFLLFTLSINYFSFGQIDEYNMYLNGYTAIYNGKIIWYEVKCNDYGGSIRLDIDLKTFSEEDLNILIDMYEWDKYPDKIRKTYDCHDFKDKYFRLSPNSNFIIKKQKFKILIQ